MDVLAKVTKLFSHENAVYKQFADHYDLVYFGQLHQEDDERIVRGVTVSAKHRDEHNCVGTVHGYDVVLLKRTDTLMMPHNPSKTEKYSWIIMQFDLHTTYSYPHVFLDGGHHDEAFYQALFIKFARLMRVDHAAFGDATTFNARFSAYTPPDALDDLPELLAGEVGETMAHHFGHLDFEWFQDRLIVYSTGRAPTKHLLEHMLRAGLWMSRILDDNGQQKISAHQGAERNYSSSIH